MIDFETAPTTDTPVGPRPAVFPVLGGSAEGVPAAETFASLDGTPITDASTIQGPRPPVVTQAYTRFGSPPAVQAAAPASMSAAARPGHGGAVAGGYPVALSSLAETALPLHTDLTASSSPFGHPYSALAAPSAMTSLCGAERSGRGACRAGCADCPGHPMGPPW